jgi:hypothetical protein
MCSRRSARTSPDVNPSSPGSTAFDVGAPKPEHVRAVTPLLDSGPVHALDACDVRAPKRRERRRRRRGAGLARSRPAVMPAHRARAIHDVKAVVAGLARSNRP